MRIIQVAAEFAPIAKAGGLGEVIVGLSRELTRIHEEVEVIIPRHAFIPLSQLHDIHLEVPDLKVLENNKSYSNKIWSAAVEECRLHLVEPLHPSGYFQRNSIYGFEDDIPRFLYFCKAVAEYLKLQKRPIDILHLHDWHTAALAPLVRDLYRNEISVKAIVFSIHSAEYQGKCAAVDLNAIGLKGEAYLTPDRCQDPDPRYPQTVNLLKGGIVYADAVVAVSPEYAREIMTPEGGYNLDSIFRKHKRKVSGILNGIDLRLWNPATDPHLFARYSSEDSLETLLAAKRTNKTALAKAWNLDIQAAPWIGAITRLVPQKAPDLIEEALDTTINNGGVFLLLGSSPIPALQRYFEKLKQKYRDNHRVLLHLQYDDPLAHQMYAALDLLVIPSLREPCGLTQMIGFRYGTLPVARATGGLKDTVIDCENGFAPASSRNGFLFQNPTPIAIQETILRACALFRNNSSAFQQLIRRGMSLDLGWEKPTQEYIRLFRKLASNKSSRSLPNTPLAI
jgi:starch synthase